jgi:DNA recombination-dependent growth factor C
LEVQARFDRIGQETCRRLKDKLVKELTEGTVHALLRHSFPRRSAMPVWVDSRWASCGSAR